MPLLRLADTALNYRLDGPKDAPLLVLANALGTRLELWDAQVPTFSGELCVLRYDARGHGHSGVPAGPYSVERMARDVLALADHLEVRRFAFCGISLGGLVGQWLGIQASERIERLILCSTAAKIGNEAQWHERLELIAREGRGALANIRDGALGRWFTADFIARHGAEAARIADMILATDPVGYAASCEAVCDADFRTALHTIRAPTLVIGGDQDATTTPEDARFLAEHIPGARLVELPAAHLCNVEQAEAFNREAMAFLPG